MKILKAIKAASMQTKIFLAVSLGVGFITVALCLHPYLWLDKNRSLKNEDVEKVKQ